MSKAEHDPTMSRRSWLAGAVTLPLTAAPVAALAGPVGDDDADLIAACERFIELEHRLNSLIKGPDRIDDNDAREVFTEPVYRAQDELLPRICVRARSLAGVRAKARAIVAWAPDLMTPFDDDDTMESELIASLLSDLAGRAVA